MIGLLIMSNLSAQQVLGVDVNQTIRNFIEEIRPKVSNLHPIGNQTYLGQCNFSGYTNSNISIQYYGTEGMNLVKQVEISFSADDVESTKERFAKAYSNKYGINYTIQPNGNNGNSYILSYGNSTITIKGLDSKISIIYNMKATKPSTNYNDI